MSKKIRRSSVVPQNIVSEAKKMSKDLDLSEVYILSDDSGFMVSNTDDVGVEYYRVIACYLDGKLIWVDSEYQEYPDND